jgi:adenine-specific DNA methylase
VSSTSGNHDTRLLERWLPIAEIGEESVRERRSMTALPPIYYLHVWWARRPLVASRAAILASLLPADADRQKFKRVLGIHGDPVASRRRIAQAKRTGVRFEGEAYGYDRAFKYTPTDAEREWLAKTLLRPNATVLDPTAGGGSIPFESVRLGLPTYANDLNPVAALIEKATIEWPAEFGMAVHREFVALAERFVAMREARLKPYFPPEPEPDCISTNYLWARTIRCPYCEGLVPLSPNWRPAPDGTGVRLLTRAEKDPAKRHCDFQIVRRLSEQSSGTVADGDATCPFSDCGRVVDGDEIKRQAQAGQMGEQLFTVVFKRRVKKRNKSGRIRESWERGYRTPRPEDDVSVIVNSKLAEKMPEWEAMDFVPKEVIWSNGRGSRVNDPGLYGANLWCDLFSRRQLLGHAVAVEVFREILQMEFNLGSLSDLTKAAFGYLALSLDKLANWNARLASWNVEAERLRSVFDRHDFAFKWSFGEMAPLVGGLGFDWAIEQTAKCIRELVVLVRPPHVRAMDAGELPLTGSASSAASIDRCHPSFPPPITLTCKSGDSLDHLSDASVDCVVIDPPYEANVMYAELSDFFYVWLKRTAGAVFPEFFLRPLTDKEMEAVANVAKFPKQKRAKQLALCDYQERMAAIFAECRRVLKPDGIMTLMFTHKATGAWDALTKGLMEAGFTITASWPINTEAEGSLHIKDKAAANSTIFLACRPRAVRAPEGKTQYWEDVEPLVAAAVRNRVAEFQTAGIRGVDLYLACFGPALEEFSRHWPLKRGTPNPLPPSLKRAQKELFPEEWDPYAVSPEDALDAARREVKRWRLDQLTHRRAYTELDPRTSWFVLAWDAFEAPVFPYDEALRLARAVGVDLDRDIVGSLCAKKGSDLTMWDSAQRAGKGALGGADGASGMIDALHHAAHQARTKTIEAGRELLERAGILHDGSLATALQAVLEVLPVGTAFSNVELPGDVAGSGSDFDALEKLRRLAFTDRVEAPQQLELWSEEGKR